MNVRLNKMIEQFINGKYNAEEFCYDFNEEWQKTLNDIDDKIGYIYDEINYYCGMYDDTHSYDDRLLNLEEFQNKVKEVLKKGDYESLKHSKNNKNEIINKEQ